MRPLPGIGGARPDECNMRRRMRITYSGGGDVGQVGGNAGGVDNIVESQLIDQG